MKIKNKWINPVLRFAAFQVALLVVLTILLFVVGQYSRETQADSIGSSIRNSFLIGDNRTVLKALNGSLHTGYILIEAIDHNNVKIFQVGNKESLSRFFVKTYEFEIYSNPLDKSSLIGKILFHYSVKNFILNSFLIWLFFLVFSSPVLILEKRRLEKNYLDDLKNHELRTITMLAEQVSHDIRSPLAVLQSIAEDSNLFLKDEALVLRRAIFRIESIANDLLNIQKNNQVYEVGNSNSVELESLNTQLEIIVAEKRLQFKNKSNVEIIFDSVENNLMVNMNQVDFYRTISNLINNSMEAIEDVGVISISLSLINSKAIIIIQDNGKGIPSDIINRIGERRFSHDKNIKNSGTGLGIYFAKNVIQSLNGTFNIKSELTKGTSITICLPIVLKVYDYILIDDDELVRLVWDSSAQKRGISFLALSSVEEFNKISSEVSKDATKIYIDSELGKDKMKGECFAKKLHEEKFKNIFIATGHPPERFENMTWLKYSSKKCPF